MRHFTQGRMQRQVRFLRQQFLQDGDLPFTDVLSAEVVSQALAAIGACWNDRIFTPLVTLWVFLGQVLSGDQSCRAAVARLIAHRVSQGLRPYSSETGAYCQARKRLPERFFSTVACQVGRNPGRERRLTMAVEGPPRISVRRVDGLHARHRGEPQGITSDLQSEAGDGVPRRANWRPHFAVVWSDPQAGDLPLRREGPKRAGDAAQVVGRVSPRRRLGGGSLDVCLDRDGDAPATWRRLHLSPHIAPHGRFSPWNASRQR